MSGIAALPRAALETLRTEVRSASWFAALDGVISTSEHETLVRVGDRLGLDEALRVRAAAAANDIACLPGGGRPERYDFVKLVARLHERLPQLTKEA